MSNEEKVDHEAAADAAPQTAVTDSASEPEHPHRQMSADLHANAGATDDHNMGDEQILVLEEEDPGFTPLNWAIIIGGIIMGGIGYLILKGANAPATNWQAIWSPIIILTSYVVIFIGILIVRKPPAEEAEV